MPRTDLDKSDLQILDELQHDASLSNQELAERVHLSAAPCLRRVRRLTDEGFIERTVAILDRGKLGLSIVAYAFISLDSHRSGQPQQFENLVQKRAEIVECVRLSGDHDYLAKIVVESMEAYTRFLDRHLLKWPAVRSVKTSFDLGQLKSTTAIPISSSKVT